MVRIQYFKKVVAVILTFFLPPQYFFPSYVSDNVLEDCTNAGPVNCFCLKRHNQTPMHQNMAILNFLLFFSPLAKFCSYRKMNFLEFLVNCGQNYMIIYVLTHQCQNRMMYMKYLFKRNFRQPLIITRNYPLCGVS